MGVVKLSTAGIRNYSKTSDFLSGNLPLSLAGGYDLLETTTLTSSASSISFTGLDTLAAGYKHLQIRMVAKAGGNAYLRLRFNNDLTNTLTRHYLSYSGGMESGWEGTTRNYLDIDNISSNYFSPSVVDILDFASQKNTTVRALTGGYSGTTQKITLTSGLWIDTSAITRLDILSTNAAQIGSRFSLYGRA